MLYVSQFIDSSVGHMTYVGRIERSRGDSIKAQEQFSITNKLQESIHYQLVQIVKYC